MDSSLQIVDWRSISALTAFYNARPSVIELSGRPGEVLLPLTPSYEIIL